MLPVFFMAVRITKWLSLFYCLLTPETAKYMKVFMVDVLTVQNACLDLSVLVSGERRIQSHNLRKRTVAIPKCDKCVL